MINNYVKGEVIQAPISKRYNREHLAAVEQVMTLKQVLTIAEIKQILDKNYNKAVEKADIFNTFNTINNDKKSQAVEQAFKQLNNIDDNDTYGLMKLALDFALSANAYINIAKRILFLTRVYEFENTENEKEKEKEKKKDEKAQSND